MSIHCNSHTHGDALRPDSNRADKGNAVGAMLDPCRFRKVLVFLGALAAVGCAARHGQDGETFTVRFRDDANSIQRVISAPVEVVWAAIPRTLQSLGYTGGPSTDPGERVYLTPYLAIRDRLYEGEPNSLYFDCGRNPTGPDAANAFTITFAILVRLRTQNEGATLVEVLLDGNATDRAQRSMSVHCTGTGRLETTILERLEAQIRIPRP